MPRVKRYLLILRNLDFAGQHTFIERAAGIILQHLRDAAELVHKTSYTGVRGPNHRPPIFHTAKDRVGDMLTRAG